MTRVVIIGDVGGCLGQLTQAVDRFADDPETVFVQVGDLVDRGPDSAGVLAFVAERLRAPGGRWIQLLGNHEGQYVGGEPFWPQRLPDADADLLRSWWLREQLRVAAAVRTADGDELLLTHAGVTFDAWRELGEPVSAATAAELLNTRPDELLWADRGPLWSEAGPDLYASWLDAPAPAPFGQAHGHSTIVDFRQRSWLCEERVRQRSTVDWAARRTITRVGMATFHAVDPKHGRDGAPSWSPLVLPGATILA